MHALLVHIYHLLLLPAHLAARPGWQSLAACAVCAVLARLSARPTGSGGWGAISAALPVVAAWAVLALPQEWPLTPVARLSGLGALALAGTLGGNGSWVPAFASALVSAWWLRGAKLDAAGLPGCVPVFAGLWAAWVVTDRLTRRDRGLGIAAGAAGLATGLKLAGAAPHWGFAALAPGIAALVMHGVPGAGAMPLLARLVATVGVAALVASDRGRVLAVDAACVAPLLLWAGLGWLGRGRTRGSA